MFFKLTKFKHYEIKFTWQFHILQVCCFFSQTALNNANYYQLKTTLWLLLR